MSQPAPGRSSRGVRPAGSAGRRLVEAFEMASTQPALSEPRRRLLDVCEREASSPGELAEVVESDAAIAAAVMRAANNGDGPPARTGGVEAALAALRPSCWLATAAGSSR
jgi:hypothetical protein